MSQEREPFSPRPEGPEQCNLLKLDVINFWLFGTFSAGPSQRAGQGKLTMIAASSPSCVHVVTSGLKFMIASNVPLKQPFIFESGIIRHEFSAAAQPQRLPQPNTSALEQSEEETGKIQNGHVGLSNINGIHNGVKHVPADHRNISAPVSQKMHRKIQSSLSVSSDGSKKSKESSAYSQKPSASPEVYFILGLHRVCSCCGCCFHVCVGLEVTPAEDLNFHFDCDFSLCDSCCETAECLKICFERSELCEYS
ncbi:hypothetical protein XELAEV_18021082mg [Xenopus laevis]|uniref:MyoD family inhibitor domain-containing protein n=1 Tax=Xenopus laevis TaxID=8355 RepID=A0A974D8V9_XENLA|nr:hypothetical protein XELAEV_18021082mg [Xenopus laevis]